MADISDLNGSQQEAIRPDESALIFSVPGSGKTRVLIECTREILRSNPLAYVLLITFSNKAAEELRQRLKTILRPSQLERVEINTFHAAALRQLTRAGKRPQVVNDAETAHYIKLALRQASGDIEFDEAPALIAACKVNPEKFRDRPDVTELTDAYNEMLRAKNKIDFTDMMLRAVSLMRARDSQQRLPRIPATHILVDELQDMDEIQLEWLACHGDDGSRVMKGVGDDDQSIYRFRGALGYAGMTRFAEMFDAKILTLNVNYRSTPNILEYADRLIRHNKNRIPKDLVADRPAGPEPRLILYRDRDEQYEHIVSAIIETLRTNPPPRPRADGTPSRYDYTVRPRQIVVLSRTNFNLMPIERELIKARVPCIRTGRKPIWKEQIVQIFTSLLSSLYARDGTGFEVAMRWYGMSDVVLEDLHKRYENVHDFFDPFHPASKNIKEYGKAVEDLAVLAGGWIRTLTNAEDRSEGAQGVIYGVSGWMLRVIEARNFEISKTKAKKDTRSPTLIQCALEILDQVRGDLRQRLIRAQSDEDPSLPCVELSTYHSSKGCEFEKVFMPDCNQGLTPSQDADLDEDALEEERRLFYVALTRCKDSLYVYADETQISQFVLEAGFVLPEEEERPELVLQPG